MATIVVVADLSTLHSFLLRTGAQRRQTAFPSFSVVTVRVVPRSLPPPASSKWERLEMLFKWLFYTEDDPL